jgi:Fe-S-cluster containining protein
MHNLIAKGFYQKMKAMHRKAAKFYKDGIHFECQHSGKCCRSRGAYGYIYVSFQDRKRLASHLGITTAQFTKNYTAKTEGLFHLRQPEKSCPFLHATHCSVYSARPLQCRTWPFWPENMNLKVWKEEIEPYCPGIGMGRLYTAEEIGEIIKKHLQEKYS